MSMTFTKKNVAAMADVLDQEYETVEEAAAAALDAAVEIIASRAKFTVVGQVVEPGNKGDKIALGWYATERQALDDALRLAYSSVTHEEARAWVLPLHHTTPHAWYMARKEQSKAEAAEDADYRDRELARRRKWVADHPGEKLPDEWTVQIATQRETDACEACDGIGRVPKEHLLRRADMPDDQKFY